MHIKSWQDIAHYLPKLQFDDAPCGASLTVFYKNKCVLDTAFGNASAQQLWDSDTLSLNFSIGKGVLATLIAVLASKDILDYMRPIADYWSKFAQNGKQNIRLIDVLTHNADLFDITNITTNPSDFGHWQAMLERVASMPVSPPKLKTNVHYGSAYSALVSGWILGGLIESVCTDSLQNVLNEYLARPLKLQGSLYFGLPHEKMAQMAVPKRLFDVDFDHYTSKRQKPILRPDTPEAKQVLGAFDISKIWRQKLNLPPDELLSTSCINGLYFDSSKLNLMNYKRALLPDSKNPVDYYHPNLLSTPIPAANGVSTSKALATIYAMHANDGIWQDKTIINQSTLNTMRRIYTTGFDAVMPADMAWRAGFHRLFSVLDAPCAYGHMGYNGSVAFCDPSRHLSVALIHNFDTTMLNDVRQFIITESILQLVDADH